MKERYEQISKLIKDFNEKVVRLQDSFSKDLNKNYKLNMDPEDITDAINDVCEDLDFEAFLKALEGYKK